VIDRRCESDDVDVDSLQLIPSGTKTRAIHLICGRDHHVDLPVFVRGFFEIRVGDHPSG
jgi:hypothetical protein